MDAVELRLYRKALSNELAIAIGSSLSDPRFTLPSLAEEIKKRFDVPFDVQHSLDYFHRWNDFVDAAEKQAKRTAISAFTCEYFRDAQPRPIHHALAVGGRPRPRLRTCSSCYRSPTRRTLGGASMN